MNIMKLSRILATVMFCLLTTIHAWSQAALGGIAGSVKDSSGAVFVSAKVVIEPTGRQVAADEQGQFRFHGLAPGR